jgi:hypothetical protein
MKCDSKDHSKHMCALKLQGLHDCIASLSAALQAAKEEIVVKQVPMDGVCGGY